MVEPVPVPDHNLAIKDARHELGGFMAISTDSQILGDPYRVAGPGVQEPEGDGQLLTVVKQWRLLILLCNGVQHVPCIGHIALCSDLTHHVPGHGVHLLRLGVAEATALELADLTLDLDH